MGSDRCRSDSGWNDSRVALALNSDEITQSYQYIRQQAEAERRSLKENSLKELNTLWISLMSMGTNFFDTNWGWDFRNLRRPNSGRPRAKCRKDAGSNSASPAGYRSRGILVESLVAGIVVVLYVNAPVADDSL